jgi:hypothetical protein
MNETVHFLAQHGYWLVVGAVLGRQACLPIPANLVLVAAGALAHLGKCSSGKELSAGRPVLVQRENGELAFPVKETG